MIQKNEAAGPTSLSDRGYGLTWLELSNVDRAEETVNRIVAQRGCEATLQPLQSADGMLDCILNIAMSPAPPRNWQTAHRRNVT